MGERLVREYRGCTDDGEEGKEKEIWIWVLTGWGGDWDGRLCMGRKRGN